MTCPNGPTCGPDCCEHPDGPRALTWRQFDALVAGMRAGRCTLRADDCNWHYDCTKHHPATAEERRAHPEVDWWMVR